MQWHHYITHWEKSSGGKVPGNILLSEYTLLDHSSAAMYSVHKICIPINIFLVAEQNTS